MTRIVSHSANGLLAVPKAAAKLHWLALPDGVRPVAEALHADHLATPAELAERTRLSSRAVGRALSWLRQEGLLQGGRPLSDGRPGFVWLDLVPAARRIVAVAA